MRKNKVIRGTKVYSYKGVCYLEKPENTHEYKRQYDEQAKCTYIYLKHNSYIIEFICLLIIVACVVFKISVVDSEDIVYYDKNPFYFNDQLFLNIDTEYLNHPIGLQIKNTDNVVIYEGTLEQNQQVGAIQTSEVTDELLMIITRKDIFSSKIQRETLFVIRRDSLGN